jgi:hypothetical protein
MALLKCEDCGRDVSSKASSCPNCGCPVPQEDPTEIKPANLDSGPEIPAAWTEKAAAPALVHDDGPSMVKVLAWIVTIVVAVFLVRACANGNPAATEPVSTDASQAAQPDAASSPAAPAEPGEAEKSRWIAILDDQTGSAAAREEAAKDLIRAFPNSEVGRRAASMLESLRKAADYERSGSQWSYDSAPEEMSGRPVKTASVTSSNTVDLGFPYGGPQHARLLLRRHPRWGNDLILAIEQGQILCHSFGDCYVAVRFDDEKLQRYEGNPPSDNSSESLFIPAFGTFMKKLPGAKKVRIEIKIYQQGNEVFEFDVSGFKPEKFN